MNEPCAFCGADSGGGYVGHVSKIPSETAIVPYCGECQPLTVNTVAVMAPDVFESLMRENEKKPR